MPPRLARAPEPMIRWTKRGCAGKTDDMPEIHPPKAAISVQAAARGGRSAAWQRWLPGLAGLRDYRREWLLGDLLAGLSVCVVMIPSVIAYAGLMGLTPQHGLYAAFIPLLLYPLIGSSRQVIVGPDIAISLLIASTVAPIAAGNAGQAAVLAAMLAILSGLLLVLAAFARLGAIADFLSKPVLVGYMTGAALILVASQLNKLFGIKLKSGDFFPRLAELFTRIGETHWPTLAMGALCLGLLVVLRRLIPKLPGALVICVGATAASLLWKLQQHGFTVVGALPRGLPSFAVPVVNWSEVHSLASASIGIALLTYTEGILLARAFAAKSGYEVSANRELVALGLADIGTGLFQGFAVTGSQARTTINDSTGCKTQVSSVAAAIALALFLLFLTPIIAQLPQVALAAILIYAGVGLVEFDAMFRIYRFYPRSAVVAGLTTLSVLVGGVVPGILFGVALSLLGLINRISRPPDAVLTKVEGHGFHDVGTQEGASTVPGLLAYRFYAPLLFTNASHFVDRVRSLIAHCNPPPRWLLLDAQAITDIDVTAVEVLHSLNQELREKHIALKIAHANPPLRALLVRTGLAAEIGPASFFNSVHECVTAFQRANIQPK
jgi:sulfate permease, SulP family